MKHLTLGLGTAALIFVLTFVGRASAMKWRGFASIGANTVSVGNVSGPLGYVGGASGTTNGTGYQHTVSAKYGYYMSGKTCTGSRPETTVENYPYVEFTWESGDPTALSIAGEMEMDEKVAQQNTYDWDCPEGPPTWSATCTVVASEPAVGSSGSSTQGGSVSQSYQHTGNPTQWTLTGSSSPPPPGYASESAELSPVDWDVDPEDPDTKTSRVSVKVTATFSGSAKEIDVIFSSLSARVTLLATVTPRP